MSSTLYETDFASWALVNADILRQGCDLDQEQRDQIAEELEGMTKNVQRERDTDARRFAEIATRLTIFPEQNSFTLDQILNG